MSSRRLPRSLEAAGAPVARARPIFPSSAGFLGLAALFVAACGGGSTPDIVGANAGGGGAAEAPSPFACDGPGQCVIAPKGCCDDIPPTLGSVQALNRSQVDAVRRPGCQDRACDAVREPNLVALCQAGLCTKHDLRSDPLSGCSADGDCVLRAGTACCESCTPEASEMVAMAKSTASWLTSHLCGPGDCDGCIPQVPAGVVAACIAGHCVATTNPPCPDDLPAGGTPCAKEGSVCEYGKDPRPSCRPKAICIGGQWTSDVVSCASLGWPGMKGCPTNPDTQGPCPTDGLLCDLAGLAVCACGTCLGPCSTEPSWSCARPPATSGCPTVLPSIGSPCSTPGLACTPYGVCGTPTSAGRICVEDRWQDTPVACPQ